MNAKRIEPYVPVGHPDYVWRSAADTDVQRTWRRYGWVPFGEQVKA
jgi:hypothetical protein